MITSRISVVPRYVETDQSGCVSDASYLPWLDMGRAALLSEQGLDYRQFESQGYLMPVVQIGLTFHHPAYYDDVLSIVTTLPERPSFRIRLEYEIWRQDLLLAQAFSIQAFVNREQRPARPPADFVAKLDVLFPPPRWLPPDLQNSTAGP